MNFLKTVNVVKSHFHFLSLTKNNAKKLSSFKYKHNFHNCLVESFLDFFKKSEFGRLATFMYTFIMYLYVFDCMNVTYITVE